MLSAERLRRLSDIGFDFEPYDTAWLDKFGKLQAFFSSEGHSNVASRHPDRELARWVVKQRVAYREHQLEEWQKQRLVSVNFHFERGDLDRRNRKYMTFKQASSLVRSLRLKSLDDYFLWARGEHGSGKFPPDLPRSPQQVYRDNGWTNWNDFLGTDTKLTRDEEAWEEMFLQYSAYVEKHGVGQIKRKDAGPKLNNWVTTQRQFQRQGRLDPERKRRLDALGFEWSRKKPK